MMLNIVPIYAAVLAVLFLALSVRVIIARRSQLVGFGAPENSDLQRRVRIHANFAEYAPFALLLLGMAELRGADPVWLHVGCASLLVGRLAHAVGLSRQSTDDVGRILGMTGSQTAIRNIDCHDNKRLGSRATARSQALRRLTWPGGLW